MLTVSPTAAEMFLGFVSSNIGMGRERVEFSFLGSREGVGLEMEVPMNWKDIFT